MKLHYSFFALLLLVFSCGTHDDEQPDLKFTPEELELIHGGSEKTWRVVQVFREYSRSRLDQMKDCIMDDTYTFSANSPEVQLNLGEVSCFFDEPEEQVDALQLSFWEEEGRLFLDHGRAESDGGSSSAIVYVLQLHELSADRMFFANGPVGNFGRALILEAID